jgi:hypothetical protein
MNVLVIPEDFRKDQYILKPIVAAMLQHLGRRSAKVRVCQDPLLGGIDQARDWERIQEVLDRYRGMVNVFLLIVDRDGNAGRRSALNNLEAKAQGVLPSDRVFLGENAWQEVEVWILAGHKLPNGWSWQEIRQEADAKEAYFEPFARQKGVSDGPGQGRKTLAEQAARNYVRLRTLCPEDLANLEGRLAGAFQRQNIA